MNPLEMNYVRLWRRQLDFDSVLVGPCLAIEPSNLHEIPFNDSYESSGPSESIRMVRLRYIHVLKSSLMPAGNRSAQRLPMILFSAFILFLIVLIAFIVLGYTSIDYDEVHRTFSLSRSIILLHLRRPSSVSHITG